MERVQEWKQRSGLAPPSINELLVQGGCHATSSYVVAEPIKLTLIYSFGQIDLQVPVADHPYVVNLVACNDKRNRAGRKLHAARNATLHRRFAVVAVELLHIGPAHMFELVGQIPPLEQSLGFDS